MSTFFSRDRIALVIAAHLGTNDAWQARNQVRQSYAWPAIYRNYLAPLLAQSDTTITP